MSESFVIFTAEKGHPWIRNIHSKESETWLWLFWQFWHKMSNFLDRKCFTQTSVEKNKHQQTLPFSLKSIWLKINIYPISWFPLHHTALKLKTTLATILLPMNRSNSACCLPFISSRTNPKYRYLSIMGKYDLLNLVQGPPALMWFIALLHPAAPLIHYPQQYAKLSTGIKSFFIIIQNPNPQVQI